MKQSRKECKAADAVGHNACTLDGLAVEDRLFTQSDGYSSDPTCDMCLYPVKCSKYVDTGTGEVKYAYGRALSGDNVLEVFDVPCGKCIECAQMESNAWSKRVVLEASLHKQNCVLTLTYRETPENGSLCKRDFQLFMKRLRKSVGEVRYFGCGEYGSKGLRPHYHLILFGFCPDDLIYFFTRNGRQFFLSDFMTKTWGLGHVLVCRNVDDYTGRYCAKYMQKFNTLPEGVQQPFLLMSRRPGIGADAYDMSWASSDKIYVPGDKPCTTPRYFLSRLERAGVDVEYVKCFRPVRRMLLSRRSLPSLRRRYGKLFSKIKIK